MADSLVTAVHRLRKLLTQYEQLATIPVEVQEMRFSIAPILTLDTCFVRPETRIANR